jgi:hypothetical protein
MLDLTQLENQIKEHIGRAVEQAVGELMSSSEWVDTVRAQAIAQIARTASKTIPIKLDGQIQDYINKVAFTGISTQTSNTELTLLDGAVVVENDFIARNTECTESLKTKDLIVTGGIAGTGLKAFEESVQNSVLEQVLQQASTTIADLVIEKSKAGIDFNSVRIDGQPLIHNGELTKFVKTSALTQVGTLNNLTVKGEALVHDTAYISDKRVGINTKDPSMSLDIWDEEVQISIGKKSERTAFVGSNRLQNLAIGVNGKGNITITDKNVVIVENLQIDKNRVSWGLSLPGYSGSKGDIVYNTNVGPKNPVFAWMCVGAYNWVALSATVS